MTADGSDHARLLLTKAREDASALQILGASSDVSDAIVGFHAQQAVEKLLKAVLASRRVAYPWTHDLRHLFELLDAEGVPLPDELADASALTPWAAEFRYGQTLEDALDREAAVALVRKVHAWAEPLVKPQPL